MSKKLLLCIAAVLSVALIASGCGSKKKQVTAANNSLPVPSFPAGSTMDRIQKAGKITVGVKFDQPGFGLKNPTTGKVEGFDVEIADLIAQGIFGGTKDDAAAKVNFVEAASKNREPFIQNGTVDMVVATYTINDTRKAIVDFAGPYYVAHGDIMVKSSDNTIKSVTDLNGKNVCTVQGSTYVATLKTKAPQANVTQFDGYSACVQALADGRVQAVTTDNVILAGYVQQSNGAYKLTNANYTDEPYGVGLKKGDNTYRDFVNTRLQQIYDNGDWKKAYEATIGKLGLPTPMPPALDRYTSTPGAPAVTGGSSTTVAGVPPSTTAPPVPVVTTPAGGTASTTTR